MLLPVTRGRAQVWLVLGLLAVIAPPAPAACPLGDLDGNCVVDIGDLGNIADHWLSDGMGPTCGDLDLDGRADLNDLALMAVQWQDAASPLRITEFMASNSTTIADDDGDFSDWMEIHNISAVPVDLEGWFLTDTSSNPTQWPFPAVRLGGGEYLLVFASEKDRRDPGGQLHTDFSLDRTGEYLAVVNPDKALSLIHI